MATVGEQDPVPRKKSAALHRLKTVIKSSVCQLKRSNLYSKILSSSFKYTSVKCNSTDSTATQQGQKSTLAEQDWDIIQDPLALIRAPPNPCIPSGLTLHPKQSKKTLRDVFKSDISWVDYVEEKYSTLPVANLPSGTLRHSDSCTTPQTPPFTSNGKSTRPKFFRINVDEIIQNLKVQGIWKEFRMVDKPACTLEATSPSHPLQRADHSACSQFEINHVLHRVRKQMKNRRTSQHISALIRSMMSWMHEEDVEQGGVHLASLQDALCSPISPNHGYLPSSFIEFQENSCSPSSKKALDTPQSHGSDAAWEQLRTVKNLKVTTKGGEKATLIQYFCNQTPMIKQIQQEEGTHIPLIDFVQKSSTTSQKYRNRSSSSIKIQAIQDAMNESCLGTIIM